jgi:hypothetical protein
VACSTTESSQAAASSGLIHAPRQFQPQQPSDEVTCSTDSSNVTSVSESNSSGDDDQSSDGERDARRRKLSPTNENNACPTVHGNETTSDEGDNDDDCHHDQDDHHHFDETEVGDILQDCGFSLMPSEDETTVPLPDPTIPNVSPEKFLLQLIEATCPRFTKSVGGEVVIRQAKSSQMKPFWTQVSDEQVAAYTTQVVTACRSNDLQALTALQESGHRLDCFNRFGESLLTMACRRGFEDIVKYLLEDDSVCTQTLLRSCDDSGRTVLHDACWNPTPQLNICRWIMEREPALWLVADNRGCSPFQYARPEHWDVWRHFLMDNRQHLQRLQNDREVCMYFSGGTSS